MNNKQNTASLRMRIWPVQGHEAKIFSLLGLIFFCVLFNNTILRIIKDTLIVTEIGAESINFLKGWIVLPAVILYALGYTRLSNTLSPAKLYFTGLIIFTVVFAVFGFLLYPLRDAIHPEPAVIKDLIASYPHFQYFISLYSVWSYCLLYTIAELWTAAGIHLLFWQLANEIVSTEQSKRFYTLFGVVGHAALVVAGLIIKYLHPSRNMCPSFTDMIYTVTGLICVVGLIIGFAYSKIRTIVSVKDSKVHSYKESKYCMPVLESLKYIVSSIYIRYITLIVICYGITVNFAEITWKSQVKKLYPCNNDFSDFLGDFYIYIGLTTTILMYAGRGIIRAWGWKVAALITPVILLLCTTCLFAVISSELSLIIASLFGVAPTIVAVFAGQIQNVLTKSTKYSLFDPTKEMTYLPLSSEVRTKGKAAVDVVGARLGKSGGGWIQQGLLIATAGSQLTIAPYLAAITLALIVVWVISISKLGERYFNMLKEKKITS